MCCAQRVHTPTNRRKCTIQQVLTNGRGRCRRSAGGVGRFGGLLWGGWGRRWSGEKKGLAGIMMGCPYPGMAPWSTAPGMVPPDLGTQRANPHAIFCVATIKLDAGAWGVLSGAAGRAGVGLEGWAHQRHQHPACIISAFPTSPPAALRSIGAGPGVGWGALKACGEARRRRGRRRRGPPLGGAR